VYRFALPQAVGLSAQLSGAQNDIESRFQVSCTTPRADALSGMATLFCLRDASAPAV